MKSKGDVPPKAHFMNNTFMNNIYYAITVSNNHCTFELKGKQS